MLLTLRPIYLVQVGKLTNPQEPLGKETGKALANDEKIKDEGKSLAIQYDWEDPLLDSPIPWDEIIEGVTDSCSLNGGEYEPKGEGEHESEADNEKKPSLSKEKKKESSFSKENRTRIRKCEDTMDVHGEDEYKDDSETDDEMETDVKDMKTSYEQWEKGSY